MDHICSMACVMDKTVCERYQQTVNDVRFILNRIASLSTSTWIQHLRYEFGDERADNAMKFIDNL